jgi:hypothetical protein
MIDEIRQCVKCGQKYKPKSKNQKNCLNPCRTRTSSIAESNAAWVDRKPRKPNWKKEFHPII